MSSRKVLIVIIIVLLIVVGVGLYFLFSGSKTAMTNPGQATQTGSLPNAGDQQNQNTSSTASTNPALLKSFGIISTESVLDYFVSPANVVTAIEPDGEIIQITNGQMSTLSNITMQNIISASFSHDGTRIMVNFGDPTNLQTSIFNIAAQTWTPLSVGLYSPTWSPSDYRVAYYTANAAQGTESFATVDASKTKPAPVPLATIHAQDLAIAWPTKNQLFFYTKPSAYVPGSLLAFSLQTFTLTPMILQTPGLAMLWSGTTLTPSAPMGLEFSSGGAGLGGLVALTDTSGNLLQQLKFLTLPSKCSFGSAIATVASGTASLSTSTPYLFCGVPRDQDTFMASHLPDDYDQMALFTSDDIYRVNLQSGALDTVFNDQTQNLDISDVKFFNNTLFFINRYDQKLYGIQLIPSE